jgi:hypothetical protein
LDHLDHFSFQKNYGGSVFSFFEYEDAADDSLNETDDSEE